MSASAAEVNAKNRILMRTSLARERDRDGDGNGNGNGEGEGHIKKHLKRRLSPKCSFRRFSFGFSFGSTSRFALFVLLALLLKWFSLFVFIPSSLQ